MVCGILPLRVKFAALQGLLRKAYVVRLNGQPVMRPSLELRRRWGPPVNDTSFSNGRGAALLMGFQCEYWVCAYAIWLNVSQLLCTVKWFVIGGIRLVCALRGFCQWVLSNWVLHLLQAGVAYLSASMIARPADTSAT